VTPELERNMAALALREAVKGLNCAMDAAMRLDVRFAIEAKPADEHTESGARMGSRVTFHPETRFNLSRIFTVKEL
jgi:hypothetical protein